MMTYSELLDCLDISGERKNNDLDSATFVAGIFCPERTKDNIPSDVSFNVLYRFNGAASATYDMILTLDNFIGNWETNDEDNESESWYESRMTIAVSLTDSVDVTLRLTHSGEFVGLKKFTLEPASTAIHLYPHDNGVGIGMYSQGKGLEVASRMKTYLYGGIGYVKQDVCQVSFESGWDNYPGVPVSLVRVGPMVFLTGAITRTGNAVGGGSAVIATIPDESFRPTTTVSTISQGTNLLVYWLSVTPDGKILAQRNRRTNATSSSYNDFTKDCQLTLGLSWVSEEQEYSGSGDSSGTGGSDDEESLTPTITFSTIVDALGYTPANEDSVGQLIPEGTPEVGKVLRVASVTGESFSCEWADGAKRDWVLKGTMTDASTSYTIDLSGCTEMFVVCNLTGTNNSTLCVSSGELINNVGVNGQRLTYGRWIDIPVGIECVSCLYCNNTTTIVNNPGYGYTHINGKNIAGITSLYLTSPENVTSCEIKIYAR